MEFAFKEGGRHLITLPIVTSRAHGYLSTNYARVCRTGLERGAAFNRTPQKKVATKLGRKYAEGYLSHL